jgi:hypothetical protein
MMYQLVLLIVMFVKHLYVLTDIYLCYRLYAAISRNQASVKTYICIQVHIDRSQPLVNVEERWCYT